MYAAIFQSLVNNLINTFSSYVDITVLKSILKNEIIKLEQNEDDKSETTEDIKDIKKYCEGCTYNMPNQQAHYGGCISFED